MIVSTLLGASSVAYAQAPAPLSSPWSVDFGLGIDNSISGTVNSSAIGRLNNQSVVILKNSYEDVYGTGLHLRVGGGYMLDDDTEVRGTFTLQSLDADVTPLGDIGVSRLYGQYSDYQSSGIDVGLRKYTALNDTVRAYGEATIGLAFIDETNVILVAPSVNLGGRAIDLYDNTTAFAFGMNMGMLLPIREKMGIFGQVGFRYVTGMSEVEGLEGTGLETINDSSSRWSFPLVIGVRARF